MSDHVRRSFLAARGVDADRFQIEAMDAIDEGRHVVVAAPTGSGKTLPAEYAIERAIAAGRRAFYTTPLKALSNQKYRDLVERHGEDAVGLLTGDTSHRPGADVVVMTTEVLRNMIYAASPDIDELAVVVLDEVHFLQDAYRGPVWEEIIIHLPDHIALVALSATVSNSGELAEWISTVRGPTDSVVETRRPVPLEDHFMVEDLTNDRVVFEPMFLDGGQNRSLSRLDESAGPRHRGHDRRRRAPNARRLATPDRVEVIEQLRRRDMLPAIVFVFSRAQCEQAATNCVDAGLVLCDDDERLRISEIVSERLAGLDPADLEVLDAAGFEMRLAAGIAAHHAGMVPPFKEAVERCFAEGLVKVVFATETLAVGVNMPARSVVIERTTKYNGDHHVSLSAGEFTQLTGRAGRRGIDEMGAAVVLWSPWVRFSAIADLAASRSFALRSVFRPTYNMVANLVRRHDHATARRLLTMSFAQFQGDAEVVRLEGRLQRRRDRYDELRATATSPYGDIDDYRTGGRVAPSDPIAAGVAALRPGDVIHARVGGYRGPVVVVATAARSAGIRLDVVTAPGRVASLSTRDFDAPPVVAGRVQLPGAYTPHRREYRQEVARRLKRVDLRPPGARSRRSAASHPQGHPVEADPDLRLRLRAADDADRVARDIAEIERRVGERRGSLGRDFDAVVGVLAELGYVDASEWCLTDDGDVIAGLFHESDLLVAEAVGRGLFNGLSAPEVAALASCVVYEDRSPEPPPPARHPTAEVARRARSLERLHAELVKLSDRYGAPRPRDPDGGFSDIAFGWVDGESFADLVDGTDLTGGDFVRTIRQVVDLCEQLSQVAPDEAVATAAAAAVAAGVRGVVADSAVVQPAPEDGAAQQ